MDSKFIAGKDVDGTSLCRNQQHSLPLSHRHEAGSKAGALSSEYMEINANNKLEPQEPLEPGIDEAHTSNGGGPQQWRVTILH